MLKTFNEVSEMIESGKLLHIAATEALIRKLPKGKWVGGSTEYFMAEGGGKVTGEFLFVTEFPYKNFSIKTYDVSNVKNVTQDAFENGFSILLIPFDSAIHKEYAQNAANFDGMFVKNIVGWITGLNLGIDGQTPIAVDGLSRSALTDKAVALHLEVPQNKMVSVNIVNIFTQDENSPVIEFKEEGFSVKNCFINGKETILAKYIEENGIDTKLPIVGDYSGNGVNVSFKSIENGVVNLYAPVFSGIQYKIANKISNYEKVFNERLFALKGTESLFSCNCILNFLYGELEGKHIDAFAGPITFGEIAYQLVNQTLVYVTVS
ncbi:MAG: hypothetical protein LBH98_02265 [Chitinispirillales bacterium]|jgi:hypothetical protein|nr:hypothetical protein [Chitinispirillales bacterium]